MTYLRLRLLECNGCGEPFVDADGEPRTFPRLQPLIRAAEADGWRLTGGVEHLCPDCQRPPADDGGSP